MKRIVHTGGRNVGKYQAETEKYMKEMEIWKNKYHISKKPPEMSIDDWNFGKAMCMPNRPGYYRANND